LEYRCKADIIHQLKPLQCN